jgi:hypothetical protein
MLPDFLVILGAALIPLVVGFVWYNPKFLGTAWMNAADMNEEKMKSANMGVIFGLAYVFSVFLGVGLFAFAVVHQAMTAGLFVADADFADPNSPIHLAWDQFLANYSDKHRSFTHGSFHGALAGFFFALPVLGTNALFERKGFKYIAINVGYWIVSFAIMGGIICQFA